MRTRLFGRLDFGAEDADPRTQMWWALSGLLVFALIAGVVLALYLRPVGAHTYRLELPETAGLAAGDDVRIAGVPVGSVTRTSLANDHVDVEFTVDSEHFVGDQTSVSVRMLTPIGGLYLALHPAGRQPLTEPIPANRAALPFLVDDMFQEATAVVEELDTGALRTALDKTAALLGESPDSVRITVTDLESVMDVMATQKDQIESLLELSNEYLRTANDNKELALEIIRGYAVLGPNIIEAADDVRIFADGLSGLAGLLFDFLSGPYPEKVEPIIPHLVEAGERGAELQASVESMTASLRETLTGLAAVAGPEGQALVDQSGLTVERPDVCLPRPGVRC
ncbi:MlaD family protein [Rhodococcus sp. Z13]|uniref:MlaD family protein n=1 Tax=Rhodococcus sacchari TaxID=2962047 RepID=A0ACD4DLH9_9NOCA|nr:MlaD family protein [Rhodococcus sp. Z13]UYP20815.1 MlaD family protein [Rhodococcus sp. Z13]